MRTPQPRQTGKARRLLRRRARGESGSALIPVLALILACSMIVTAVIAMSQLNAYTMAAHVKLQKSMYVCEGAANRVQWLVAAERNANPSLSYDTFDYSESDYDRFLPDGVEHSMDYHGTQVRFTITDAAAGLDFSSRNRNTILRRLRMNSETDTGFIDSLDALQDQITDYTDSDSSSTDEGREESDYELLNRLPLPRNADFQYREELFFIPEFLALFPPDSSGRLTSVRIIPPANLATVTTRTQTQPPGGGPPQTRTATTNLFETSPNLFGAPDLYLTNVFNLEDGELAEIREGIRLYQSERTKLADSIDSTILQKLRNSNMLTWSPGKTYSVTVDPSGGRAEPAKRLAFTWTVPDGMEGPSDGIVRYLEWMFY